jgi:hypothetical protein
LKNDHLWLGRCGISGIREIVVVKTAVKPNGKISAVERSSAEMSRVKSSTPEMAGTDMLCDNERA